MPQTGSCLCGAVSYEIKDKVTETGACHCEMCRKWSGGVYLGVQVPDGGLRITGPESITTFTSSPWAERSFCKICGSNLWYRVTASGPHSGTYHLGMGTLNETDGISLTGEIYIDQKPGGYRFANKTHQMTRDEVMAMFGMSD